MTTPVSRREFLRAAAVVTGGLAPVVAAVAAPSPNAHPVTTTIIDTHTHFYDPSRPEGVPWPGKEDVLLHRTVLPRDYRALPVPRPVSGTVVVEASPWVEDNQWILDLAANDPFIVGFVGNLPAGTPEFANHLKRFARNRLFRGIRIGGTRLRQGLGEATFIEDMKHLARNNLALDLLGGPDTLPDAARLAATVPDLRIIIDHVANLRIDGSAPPRTWLDGIAAVARHKRVFCKVSGLVEGTGRTQGDAPRDAGFYRPVLDHVWNEFGRDRLVYGSNWPVSARFATLATVQGIVSDYFEIRGRKAVEAVFSRNAKTFYQWIQRR